MGILSMNSRELNDWADQKSESGMLKLIARWGMTASIPAMIAAMTWIGTTLWALNTEQANVKGQLIGLRAELTGSINVLVERIGQDIPRKSEIEGNFKIRDYRLDDHTHRIQRLEQKQ